MSERIYLNRDWLYNKSDMVDIPHMGHELPYNYLNEKSYQGISTYEKDITIKNEWRDSVLILTFLGVAHKAVVYANGEIVAVHNCGYTAFEADITQAAKRSVTVHIKVVADSNEDLNIPPFGNVVDYLTYEGMYRDVYLEVKNPQYIADVYVKTRFKKLKAELTVSEFSNDLKVAYEIYEEGADKLLLQKRGSIRNTVSSAVMELAEVNFWSTESPSLYRLKVKLFKNDKLIDEKELTYGYRDIEFRSDGFYLNGKKTVIRGLNRHQAYPYVGYAMPASMQIFDAKVLKYELGLNAVRTSHYPQSHDFIDACDRIGLLVFTEIPGWQHIGDAEWKEQAVVNTKEMITQYRNHPSIILWGVRINESKDCDELYERTNALAKSLDSRPTGGVRCIKKSKLLEDVYTYNDFSHEGNNRGVDLKKKITSDISKAYLISEYNGHMYPTKAFDDEEHRLNHALRHARVLNDVLDERDIAGSFGWCMSDYNTHKDFGSGDRICYHGVTDMFRNKKMAGYVYQSQSDDEPVLEISSSMDIGEHPAGRLGKVYAFTNADSVRLYKNDVFVAKFIPQNKEYNRLSHPPILIDDLIGDSLIRKEGLTERESEDVKKILNDYLCNGMHLSVETMAIAARLAAISHFNFSDLQRYFEKYIGNWGCESVTYRFEAIKNGKVVKTVTKGAAHEVILKTEVSSAVLTEEHTYDTALVRIQAVDENDNVLPYYNEPIILETEGGIRIIGPKVISLKGGMGGCFVRSYGYEDTGTLILKGTAVKSQTVDFIINHKEGVY